MDKIRYNENMIIYCKTLLKYGIKYKIFDNSDLLFWRAMTQGRNYDTDSENKFYRDVNNMIKSYADDYMKGEHTEENYGFCELWQEMQKVFIF